MAIENLDQADAPLLAVKANPVIAFLYPWKDLAPIKPFPSSFVYTCSIPTEPW